MNTDEFEISDFATLCKLLTTNNVETIYLIHQVNREPQARQFASWLRHKGFVVLVAADYRKLGIEHVENAIAKSDFSIVLAFDDDAMKQCQKQGVSFIKFK